MFYPKLGCHTVLHTRSKLNLTRKDLKNFCTCKDECGHFLPFICKTVYEHFLSNYCECFIETSQSIILASFCKVKKQPGEEVACTENKLLSKHFIRTQSAKFLHIEIVALPNACFPQQTFLQFWYKLDLFLHDTNWWFFLFPTLVWFNTDRSQCIAGCLGPLTCIGRYTAHYIFWHAKLFHKLE